MFVVYNIYIYIFYVYNLAHKHIHEDASSQNKHSKEKDTLTTHFSPDREGRGGRGKKKLEAEQGEQKLAITRTIKKTGGEKIKTALKFLTQIQLLPNKHFTFKAGKNRKQKRGPLLRRRGAKHLPC